MSVPYEPASVPALNLRAQYQTIRDEIEPVVRQVLETQGFVMGPEVSSLEAEISEYVRRGPFGRLCVRHRRPAAAADGHRSGPG